jgi:hypothetical protein
VEERSWEHHSVEVDVALEFLWVNNRIEREQTVGTDYLSRVLIVAWLLRNRG